MHCQTLATLKSEGTSCLNNQIKKTSHLRQKELTLTNKEQNKIFQDFSKLRPDRNASPVASPIGDEKLQLSEVQQEVKVASPVNQVTVPSPIENRVATPMKASPIASPLPGSPKPQTPVTPTLEDNPATPIKAASPQAPVQDTNRKSVSPALIA